MSPPGISGAPPGPVQGKLFPSEPPEQGFRPAPTLDLRSELRNPIRTEPARRIESLGHIKEALIEDFLIKKLTVGDAGPKVIQVLGSFPGWLQPEAPLGEWKPDQKPDINVIGDAHAMVAKLAPLMGWDAKTTEANARRAREGMIYFNLALETPQGPVPFKMGILDATLWRQGSHPYFDLRSSLLQADGPSYIYLSPEGTPEGMKATPPITQNEFQTWLRRVQADYMRRSIETFLFRSGFSAQDLIDRRYSNQFFNYEIYRIFDWGKGKKQAARYAERIPHILAPAVRDYVKTHPDALEVHHPDKGTLKSDQITPQNFRDLHFSWKRGFLQRVPHWWHSQMEFLKVNGKMARQTFRNIASNRTSRPGHHKINWFSYGLRKFGRKLGYRPENHPRGYPIQAHGFKKMEQRLGKVPNPVEQMIVLAGYPPTNEEDPVTFEKIVDYVEAEIQKGLKPNITLYGNNPSKFTFPIRGVPMVAYRLMEALRSPVIKHVVVVGVPDVGVVTKAFKEHYGEEIKKKGMTIEFQDVSLEGGSYAKNIQRGLDHRPNTEKLAILSPGDTPLVDPHNMAYHPWRHSLDYIIGANGREMVMDFMGMNAHLTQYAEGVPYAFKEGNSQGVKKHLIELVDEIYSNRKSVKSGAWNKLWIVGKFAAGKIIRPQTLDTLFLTLPRVAWYSGSNFIKRKAGLKVPKPAWEAQDVERATIGHLDWKLDLRSTHLDPGSLVDVDGIRDYLLVELLAREMPREYQGELQKFSETTLQKYLSELPGMKNTPQRINELYRRVYNEILDKEAQRPAEERFHIDAERLKRNGIDPDRLPFIEEGEHKGQFNPEWVQQVLPRKELERYKRAFQAYFNRGKHAESLMREFLKRVELRKSWPPSTEQMAEIEMLESTRTPREGEKPLTEGNKRAVQQFALWEIAKDPHRYRSLILEWEFDRVQEALLEAAKKRFGNFSSEAIYLRNYLNLSLSENFDTPLRRVLLGLKAADSVRRYHPHLAPEEYRKLYPQLAEHMTEASEGLAPEGVPKNKRESFGNYLLRQYFKTEQSNLDRVFVRKVGESPPPYRRRGFSNLLRLSHSNSLPPVRPGEKLGPLEANGAPWLPVDVALMADRLEILPQRIPHLMAQGAGVSSGAHLELIPQKRMSFERTLAWTQTKEGQEFLKKNHGFFADNWQNRLAETGPALGAGLLALLGSEYYLADRLGLDPVKNPHERFMLAIGLSHLASTGTQHVTEVLRNHKWGTPFHYATTRAVQAGGEKALQYRFYSRSNLGAGLWSSLTRNYGLYGGPGKTLFRGAWGLGTLPVRASWNMGPGLMSAALTDRVVSQGMMGLDHADPLRRGIHFGSFFLPDVARIAMGNKTPLLFRNWLTRGASRAFAAGFIADMAFSAHQRIQYDPETVTRQGMIYQRANELNDAVNGNGLLDGALELVAPQVAAWWDSVNLHGLSAQPNKYQKQATQEMEQYLSQVDAQARDFIQGSLLEGRGDQYLDSKFYQEVDLSFLESTSSLTPLGPTGRKLPLRLFLEEMNKSAKFRAQFESLGSPEKQRRLLQNRYSGWNLTQADAGALLQKAALVKVQGDLASLQTLPFSAGVPLKGLFDEKGRLKSGSQLSLLREVFKSSQIQKSDLLDARRQKLLQRIQYLAKSPAQASSKELQSLRKVARQLGLKISEPKPIQAQGQAPSPDQIFHSES